MEFCIMTDIKYSWQELVEWASNHLKGTNCGAVLYKLAWWAAVYHIWQQRNAIIHCRRIKTEEQIVRDIKRDVKGRVESTSNIFSSILNRILCCKWGITSAVLCCVQRLLSRLFFNIEVERSRAAWSDRDRAAVALQRRSRAALQRREIEWLRRIGR